MSHDNFEHYSLEDDDDQAPVPIAAQRKRCTDVKCGSQSQSAFCTPLSFDQELALGPGGFLVPLSTLATNTDGIRGVLKLKFNSSLSRAAYALYVFGATNPTNRIVGAHLHAGSTSQTGPVVVDLFNGPARNVNGLLIKGLIDNSSIAGLNGVDEYPTVNSVASLYSAIQDGYVYANVHSAQFPDGVVRGQIYPAAGL